MKPELSRPIPAERVGARAETHVIETTAAERAALALRLGVAAVHALGCRFTLVREGGSTIRAEGALRASVAQICVVSLEPFVQAVADDFTVRFKPEVGDTLDLDQPDEIPYQNGTIDLGEATTEQLALNLDPYPRRPDLPDELDDDEL